jgi:ATP-binding cassette subfamily C protein CydCD
MYFDWRLFGMTAGVRGRIVLATLVGLAGLPIGLLRLSLLGVVIAQVIRGQSLAQVAPLIAAIAGLTLLRALVQYGKEEISNRTAAEMKIKLRQTIYRRVLELGPGPFDQKRTGGLLLSLVDGVEQLESFFGQYLPQLVIAGLTPLIIFGFMAWLDLPTAMIFLVFALTTLLGPSAFHRWNSSSSLSRREAWAAMGSDLLDAIQGLGTLKLFGRSRAHGELLAVRARNLYRSTMAVLAVNIATSGITILSISAGAAIALGWGAVRVQQGALELQTLLIVLMLGVEVFRPLRELTQLYHRGMIAMSASQAIYDILDAQPDVLEPAKPVVPEHISPTVRFENVTFGYATRRVRALDDVSFTLNAGETIGVVGPSGAGKSTLVWLLQRFYDPTGGRILLDGHDLRDLPTELIRRQIAVVAQDTYLFHATIAENLRLGKPDATLDELERAARAANAHDFIMSLPHAYDTVVGERGSRLSGGQRQRIAIARAILADAPILVLDEALSSVDTENEAIIQEALDRLQRGRTTLVIAHRLSSVANADRILVFDDGRIVEQGTHAELIGGSGLYSRLMSAQGAEPAPEAELAELPAVLALNGHVPVAAKNGVAGPASTRIAAVSASDGSRLGLWGRLLGLVRPWAGTQVMVLILGVAHAAAVVGVVAVSALLASQVARGGDLTPWLWALAIMVPVAAFLTWAESWLAHDLAYRLLAEMRIDLYEKLEPLAPGFLMRRRSGDLVSAASSDVETIEYFFAHTIAPAFVAVLVPTSVLIVLGSFHWAMPLALLPFLIAVAASPAIARKLAERLGMEVRQKLGDVNAHMVDSVQGLRTIAMFRQGPARLGEIEANGRLLSHFQLRFLRNQTIQSGTIEALTGLGGLTVLVAGAYLVGQGHVHPAFLALATLLALSSFGPVTDIAKVAKELAQTLASARRIFAVHDEPVVIRDGEGARVTDGVAPRIEFDSVVFSYGPGEPQALVGASFVAEPGQTVAIVGRSGAGKTTLINLLARFWDPASGRITLDGHDLREFKLDDLRRHIAMVAQDTYLFNATLRQNITLGRPDATDQQIWDALNAASAAGFVDGLPDGLETLVGERGVQLSGGQRQRIAIARAILKDAPILVLDEATSHLDAESERLVRGALERLMRGRTTLVIAHRLSTIRNADKIIALENGRVVEQGTHDELVARDGVYAQLIVAQINAAREPTTVR